MRMSNGHAATSQEHQGQSIVLAGEMPRAPAGVDREEQARKWRPVEASGEQPEDQQRGVHGEEPIPAPITAMLVDAQQRRPVVGCVGEEGKDSGCERGPGRDGVCRAGDQQQHHQDHIASTAPEKQIYKRTGEPARGTARAPGRAGIGGDLFLILHSEPRTRAVLGCDRSTTTPGSANSSRAPRETNSKSSRAAGLL